jgi:glycosyltransferase involved in cell wall biosynthesis
MSYKVSVVTPSHNQGAYISQTIESVLSQDYPHLEYWIIDGGSQDETLAVIQSFAHDPRLHWISEADGGMSAALNKGFQRTGGELLTWINSDDLLAPGALRRVVQAFEQTPTTQLIYGELQFIEADGRPGPDHMGRPFDLLSLLGDYFGPIPQPGCFWRRTLWETLGPLREDLHYTMDLDYWLRATQHTWPHFLPALQAYCRVHPHSKTTSQEVQAFQERGRLLGEYLGQHPIGAGETRQIWAQQAYFLAQAHWRAGDHMAARVAIRGALRQARPWHLQTAYWLALAADYHLQTQLAPALSRAWRGIKKRLRG